MSARRPDGIGLPVALALLVHAGLAAGLAVAGQYSGGPAPAPASVEIRLVEAPPPPPEPEVTPPPPPPEPDPPRPDPVKPPPPKVAEVSPKDTPPPEATPAPVSQAPTPEPPAPGPPDTGAAAPYVYKMETGAGGNMGVQTGGAATGATGGRPGGTGTGTGGGGPPGSIGTGAVATIASIKTQPKPLDSSYDHVTIKESEYPEQARRRGVEGQVVVRILVGIDGGVGEAKLVKGLGHGLDEHALRMARKLRFTPARDTNDRIVATRISWSFQFDAPDDL